MEDKKVITASLEDYLKAVYFLHKTDASVRLTDISERMSVSKPSAFNAVSQLADMGLAEHIKFGPVYLTAQGIETAQNLVAKHEIIKRFLMRVLNIGETLASSEACAIEHTIRDATLAKMASLI
ncbi:MAG: metal-dependent transcriptional regulator [Gracilibacteraceae bacterium]|jgi:DtxR family Mn-dependent transcriptional regulator|nr:metal-dependent transcriptional regulator [Gracilibacteraceae bacterium]